MSNYNPADRDQANLNPDVMYTHHGRYLPDPEARHDQCHKRQIKKFQIRY
jgi:hypothetical protein